MKDLINNITTELQERNTNELTQQEKRENEKLYKKELKKEIKDTLKQEFEKQQEEGETLNNIYKFIIENCDTIQDNIINTLYNYSIEHVKIKAQDQFANENKNKNIYIIEKTFPFKDFDIAEDVEDQFFKILKTIYNNYKIKIDIKEEETNEELKQLFLQYYNNFGYFKARSILYDTDNKNIIINATKKRSRHIINKNYYKILNEVDKTFKISNMERIETEKQLQKARTRTTTRKKKRSKRGLLYIGAFTIGVFRGLTKNGK